jgi:opine dehydrogenase
LDGSTEFVPIAEITRDSSTALQGADVALVLVQSIYHEQVARLISPFVGRLAMLLVVPGYMGSLYFKRAFGNRVDIIAEGESTAYDARIVSDGHVAILYKNVRNALSFIDSGRSGAGIAIASQLVATYQYTRKHVVESALHNPNMIVHTVGAILSAARIEFSGGEFWMYKEGFTPAIWNIVEQLDGEKTAILLNLGCEPLRYLDACRFRNETDLSVDSLSVFREYARTGGPKGPSSVNTRYIYEDVPMGLCLMSSIGKLLKIPTPTCDSLVTLGGGLLKSNFWEAGRSLSGLGLGFEEFFQLVK